MRMTPLPASIVVPSFARPQLLRACLTALAGQSVPPLEVLVVGRIGDDETAAVVTATQGVARLLTVTARGHLRLCLFGDAEIDLRTPLRDGAGDAELERIIRGSMLVKPERHHLERGASASQLIALSQTGG